ncbi:MAG: DUF2442 domain-containing protein [Spirochaetaceae bacterium]|nr:DUF2442 domain-containing protein [Spirochaetaceae bacterium]
MYIINDIVYAGEPQSDMTVTAIKVLDGGQLILTFDTGEKRLFDITPYLTYPAFTVLKDEAQFKTASIQFGTVSWCNGTLDIAPETLYANSFKYEEPNSTQHL